MAIRLPDKPKGNKYEDFVFAAIKAQGYFTETRLTLKEGSVDILELDVVATPSGAEYRSPSVVEAKSGKWGFSDLMKLLGQITYLSFEDGCIVYDDAIEERRERAFQRICRKQPIRTCRLSFEHFDADQLLVPRVQLGNSLRTSLTTTNWFLATATRLAYGAFKRFAKEHSHEEVVRNVQRYELALQQAFFAKSPLRRVIAIYDAYKASPNITGSVVEYVREVEACSEDALWNRVRDTHRNLETQYVLYLEVLARCSVVKNALDHVLSLKRKHASRKTLAANIEKAFRSIAPRSFVNGLEAMEQSKHCLRIPYLLQIFFETFGGFYLPRLPKDIELLGKCSGIPPEEVVERLELVDQFFPMSGKSWFIEAKSELRYAKMVPEILRGAGCFMRGSAHKAKEYRESAPRMSWLLSKWHNSLYHALQPELAVKE